VTISWETSQAAPSQAIVDGRVFDGGSGTSHRVLVDGLQPSHAYTYHLEVGAQRSDEAELTTAAQPGERVRFAVYGDNRTDGDAHRQVVQAIDGERPDFILNSGDMVGESNESEWHKFFAIEYGLLMKTPLFAAIGNHEADFGDNTDRFYTLFGGRTWYSMDYGDVHVAAIDSNGYLESQAAWLENDLTLAESRGARHLFVVMHWGPYSSGQKLRHGNNDEAQEHIVPILRQHRVDAVFAGHDHFYERGQSGDLTYFVTGGGGAPLDGPGSIQETRMARSLHHYLIVDVLGESAHVSAHDLTGAVFDETDLLR